MQRWCAGSGSSHERSPPPSDPPRELVFAGMNEDDTHDPSVIDESDSAERVGSILPTHDSLALRPILDGLVNMGLVLGVAPRLQMCKSVEKCEVPFRNVTIFLKCLDIERRYCILRHLFGFRVFESLIKRTVA